MIKSSLNEIRTTHLARMWSVHFAVVLFIVVIAGCVVPASDSLVLAEIIVGSILIAFLGAESLAVLCLAMKKPAFVLTVYIFSKLMTQKARTNNLND